MSRAVPAAKANLFDNPAIADLDALIAELTDVIDNENELLATGMPASLAATTGRKSNLAARIQDDLKAIGEAGHLTDRDRAYLDQRVGQVQTKARENLSRLAGAIGASRRRIAAVVAAVREGEASASPVYGRTGAKPMSNRAPQSTLLPDQLA